MNLKIPAEEDVLDPSGAVLLLLAPHLEHLVLVLLVCHLPAGECTSTPNSEPRAPFNPKPSGVMRWARGMTLVLAPHLV